jgi:hypothetical protein
MKEGSKMSRFEISSRLLLLLLSFENNVCRNGSKGGASAELEADNEEGSYMGGKQ